MNVHSPYVSTNATTPREVSSAVVLEDICSRAIKGTVQITTNARRETTRASSVVAIIQVVIRARVTLASPSTTIIRHVQISMNVNQVLLVARTNATIRLVASGASVDQDIIWTLIIGLVLIMMNVTTANTPAASFVATRQGATTVIADQDIILMATSEHAKDIRAPRSPIHLMVT